MSDWLFETDAEGRLTFVCEGFARCCPGRDPVARREHLLELCKPLRKPETVVRGWLAQRVAFRDLLVQVETAEGKRQMRLAGRPWHDEAGVFRGYHGAATDMTESRRAQAEAAFYARFEPLTGLAKRRLLQEPLEELGTRVASETARAPILFIDLDHFKAINDNYGHKAGDAVLMAVSQRLCGRVRECDRVARVGGDEFVLLVEGVDRSQAAQLAFRVIHCLSQPLEVFGRTVKVGASVGFALLPDDGRVPDDL